MKYKKHRSKIVSLKEEHPEWGKNRVGKALGINPSDARKILRAMGYPPTPVYHRSGWTYGVEWKKATLIYYYYEVGYTLQEIGDVFHVGRERVRQVMERFGLKRRRVGNRLLMR